MFQRSGWCTGAHEFRSGAARHLGHAGLQALLVLDLLREFGIRDAILLEGLGFGFAQAARDVFFDEILVHSREAQEIALGEAAFLENLPESPARATQRLIESRFGQIHLLTNDVFVMIVEIKAFEHQAIPGLRQFAQQRADCEGCLEVCRNGVHALRRIGIPLRRIAVYICSLSLSLAQ